MRAYVKLFGNSFRTHFAYKSDALFGACTQVIQIFVTLSVWKALYHSTGGSNPELATMIYYTLLSAGISIAVNNKIIYRIEDKIRTGEIATDIIKPIHFPLYLLSISAGETLYNVAFRLLPILLLFIPFYGMYIPSLSTIPVFLLSLLNGALISFLLAYILGLCGFWYLSIWHLDRILWDLTRLLSGSLIPLWMFPGFLMRLSDYLPFTYMYYVPICIYLEKLTMRQGLLSILFQLFWIAILYSISRCVWKRGISKLVVQGG